MSSCEVLQPCRVIWSQPLARKHRPGSPDCVKHYGRKTCALTLRVDAKHSVCTTGTIRLGRYSATSIEAQDSLPYRDSLGTRDRVVLHVRKRDRPVLMRDLRRGCTCHRTHDYNQEARSGRLEHHRDGMRRLTECA